MFEAPIDRFCGPVRRARAVEERQDVRGSLFQGPAEPADLDQCGRDACGDRVDDGLHQLLSLFLVRFPVRGDDPLIDAPRRLNLDVFLGREDSAQARVLLLGEQVRARVQGPPSPIQRITGTTSMPEGRLLDALPAPVQPVPGEPDHWGYPRLRGRKGSMTGTASGSSSEAAVLNPVNPSMATTSTPSRHA